MADPPPVGLVTPVPHPVVPPAEPRHQLSAQQAEPLERPRRARVGHPYQAPGQYLPAPDIQLVPVDPPRHKLAEPPRPEQAQHRSAATQSEPELPAPMTATELAESGMPAGHKPAVVSTTAELERHMCPNCCSIEVPRIHIEARYARQQPDCSASRCSSAGGTVPPLVDAVVVVSNSAEELLVATGCNCPVAVYCCSTLAQTP